MDLYLLILVVIFRQNMAQNLLCPAPHPTPGQVLGCSKMAPASPGGFPAECSSDIFTSSYALKVRPIWTYRKALKPYGCLSGDLDQPQPSGRCGRGVEGRFSGRIECVCVPTPLKMKTLLHYK